MGPLRLEPFVKRLDNRFRLLETSRQPQLITAHTVLVFNVEQLAEVCQCRRRLSRRAEMMAGFKLAATVHPATRLEYARPQRADALVGDISIGGEVALESRELRFDSDA